MPEKSKECFGFNEIAPKNEMKEKTEYSKEEIMKEIDKLELEIVELQVQADTQKELLDKTVKTEERSAIENVISETEIKIKGKQNIQDGLRIRVGEIALKKEIETGKYE